MSRRRRRWLYLCLGTLFVGGCLVARPLYHLAKTAWHDRGQPEPVPRGFVDDASRLNRTAVAETWDIPADPAAAEEQLRQLLGRARRDGLRVAIAGARHTMGGHTIFPGGIALNMLPFNQLELDEKTGVLTAGAGARWAEIIPYLDRRGFSVAIMQSNNSFSVGGSVSANCHGWQHGQPPLAATVTAFRLMKADGTIARCTRTDNAELFHLVLGGYGLFGIILDVDLRVVPNNRYRLDAQVIPAENYVATFRERVGTDAGLVYGRLCIVPGAATFLREAILTVARQAPCQPEDMPSLKSPGYMALRRTLFRGSVDSAYGKELRWKTEKRVVQHLGGRFFSRNQLLNEGVEVYQERSAERTDILHEYFLPPEQVGAFLEQLRRIIPRHKCDLLNVTVRDVRRDDDTVLRYADQDMFAFVMLFSQPRTPAAEAEMTALTRALIDAALELGGRYYLPYRLHATPEQFHRAYPQAVTFFEQKRRHDPDELFQNEFYRKYGRPQD